MRWCGVLGWLVWSTVAACSAAENAPSQSPSAAVHGPDAPEAAPQPAANTMPDARQLIGDAARTSVVWSRVDDELHWAPELCRAPLARPPQLSAAAGPPHQDKVFTLRALDVEGYARAVGWIEGPRGDAAPLARGPLPAGVVQAIVKDAHVPVPIDAAAVTPMLRPAMRDGQAFVEGDALAAFVMIELAADATIPSDGGWIYGTVAPSGEVLEAGVIAACKDCHGKQPSHLFGIPKPPVLRNRR